jgi:hypothetical protein
MTREVDIDNTLEDSFPEKGKMGGKSTVKFNRASMTLGTFSDVRKLATDLGVSVYKKEEED